MESDKIILFRPVLDGWNLLSNQRSKSVIHIKGTDSVIRKIYGHSLNFAKKRMIEVLIVVGTIFTSIYSLITYPVRWYQNIKITEFAIDTDLSRITSKEIIKIESDVNKYFDKHSDHFQTMSKSDKAKLTRLIVSQCARSQRVYGPIVREWVDHLLEKASQNGNKLVFMARDGLPYYEVAKRLMETAEYKEKFPSLTRDGSIVLGYFSRNVVKSADGSNEGREIFRRYIAEELHIQPGDRCIFCDIGFSGSMVKPIRDLIPDVQVEFNFLVATSNRAEGYLGNPSKPLPHLETAASNMGVRWLEESHHGNIASATKLIVDDQGHVRPDTLSPKKVRFDEKFSQAYLIRKFCLRSLIDSAVQLGPLSKQEVEKARELFSQTIGAIKDNRLPLFVGWDY